jgi:hypothetical protein
MDLETRRLECLKLAASVAGAVPADVEESARRYALFVVGKKPGSSCGQQTVNLDDV